MAYTTPKTNWTPADGVTDVDLNRIEGNISEMSNAYTATGTATDIILNCGALSNSRVINFIASNGNSGASTRINGIPVYRPGTTQAPTFTAGKMYTVWYVSASNCFFLKASAEGTALASHVLKNYTFSNNNDTGIAGTLNLDNLISANIKAGVTINGVTGKSSVVDTSDVTATASQILSGYFAYKDGVKQSGNIPVKAGSGWIEYGSQINRGASGRISIRPAAGYFDGNAAVCIDDGNFNPANILAGVSMLGLLGTGRNGSTLQFGTFAPVNDSKQTINGVQSTPRLFIGLILGDHSSHGRTALISIYCNDQGWINQLRRTLGYSDSNTQNTINVMCSGWDSDEYDAGGSVVFRQSTFAGNTMSLGIYKDMDTFAGYTTGYFISISA